MNWYCTNVQYVYLKNFNQEMGVLWYSCICFSILYLLDLLKFKEFAILIINNYNFFFFRSHTRWTVSPCGFRSLSFQPILCGFISLWWQQPCLCFHGNCILGIPSSYYDNTGNYINNTAHCVNKHNSYHLLLISVFKINSPFLKNFWKNYFYINKVAIAFRTMHLHTFLQFINQKCIY